MKKIVCVLLTLILAEISFSQENFSFIDDDMQWAYIVEENEEMWQFKIPSIETVRYKYDGDTIINAVLYKKMLKSSDNGKSWKVLGCFRQDEHKVYFISNGSAEEYLTYDFSDDMECRIKSDHHVYSLISDSITINTIKKARWGFPHTDPNSTNQQALSDNIYDFVDVIIEDMGSVYSPCFDTLPFSPAGICGARYYTYLLCVQKGNNVIWHNPNYEECYYERTAVETIENNLISLSPNPVKDILTLTMPSANNEIKIFDLQGKLLLQQNVGFSAEINVSMLTAGTYVLVVNGESYKFVKE